MLPSLTDAQKLVLKNWIVANNASLFDQSSVTLLNADAAPAAYCYRPEVPVEEVMTNGFDWTRVDNLSVGKARIWEWLTQAKRTGSGQYVFDASKSNIRAGINAVWVGTAADLAVRAAVYLHCYRPMTVAELLLRNEAAGGTGTTPAQDGSGPYTLGAYGAVTLQEVVDAAGV